MLFVVLDGQLDRLVSVDRAIVRAHQHCVGAPAASHTGGGPKDHIPEPADHAIGRSRGGLTTKVMRWSTPTSARRPCCCQPARPFATPATRSSSWTAAPKPSTGPRACWPAGALAPSTRRELRQRRDFGFSDHPLVNAGT